MKETGAEAKIDDIKKEGAQMREAMYKRLKLDQSAHPGYCFFSFFFKGAAVIV